MIDRTRSQLKEDIINLMSDNKKRKQKDIAKGVNLTYGQVRMPLQILVTDSQLTRLNDDVYVIGAAVSCHQWLTKPLINNPLPEERRLVYWSYI